ncbi:MAG: outer membrane lipoprotein carrier protein LolA [Bacteroidales bacterium]|jgi:outer membrane lipoprotein-sorting protein|nr:outer membrane lipoprotein carrier protein LolA [Bacteroidales bacterium]
MKNKCHVVIFLPLLFWLCTGFLVHAQDVDGGATQYLNELSAKYLSLSSLKIQFSFHAEKDKQILQNYKGTVFFAGDRFHLNMPEMVLKCDGKTLWNYQKETNELSIFDYDADEQAFLNPVKLLNQWQNSYRAKWIKETTENGKNNIIIDITPKQSQTFYKIRLFIDKTKKDIVKCAIYEKDNTIFTYNFDKMQVNLEIPSGEFLVDLKQYPGATINDMR